MPDQLCAKPYLPKMSAWSLQRTCHICETHPALMASLPRAGRPSSSQRPPRPHHLSARFPPLRVRPPNDPPVPHNSLAIHFTSPITMARAQGWGGQAGWSLTSCQRSVVAMTAVGGVKRGSVLGSGVFFSTVDGAPFFLQAKALMPFVSEDLIMSTSPTAKLSAAKRKMIAKKFYHDREI